MDAFIVDLVFSVTDSWEDYGVSNRYESSQEVVSCSGYCFCGVVIGTPEGCEKEQSWYFLTCGLLPSNTVFPFQCTPAMVPSTKVQYSKEESL